MTTSDSGRVHVHSAVRMQSHAGAPDSAKFRGGCRGPAKIRQRGGAIIFFYFLRDKNITF